VGRLGVIGYSDEEGLTKRGFFCDDQEEEKHFPGRKIGFFPAKL
jgi:hypothetical protein